MLMYRKLLLSFLVAGGFYMNMQCMNVMAEVMTAEAVQPSLNSIVPDQKPKVKVKHKARKKEVVITPPIEIEPDLLYKPLDLSVPFINDQDDPNLLTDRKKGLQNQSSDYFDTKTKAKPRALELKGNFITSPEPELEKKKTVDGAGFSINVKPD